MAQPPIVKLAGTDFPPGLSKIERSDLYGFIETEALDGGPMMGWDARQLSLAGSELVKREVFTKTLKCNLMVRKPLLWKTHKGGDGTNHPAFAAYFTGFGPGRAIPLDRDIRIGNFAEQIEKLYGDLKAENIVKSWAPVDPVRSLR